MLLYFTLLPCGSYSENLLNNHTNLLYPLVVLFLIFVKYYQRFLNQNDVFILVQMKRHALKTGMIILCHHFRWLHILEGRKARASCASFLGLSCGKLINDNLLENKLVGPVLNVLVLFFPVHTHFLRHTFLWASTTYLYWCLLYFHQNDFLVHLQFWSS